MLYLLYNVIIFLEIACIAMLYSYPYLRMLLLSFVKLKCVNYNVLPSRTRTHLVINILLMSLKANLICVLVIPLKWRILHRSLEWFEVPNSTSFRNFKGHMPGGWSGIFCSSYSCQVKISGLHALVGDHEHNLFLNF